MMKKIARDFTLDKDQKLYINRLLFGLFSGI